MRRENRRRSPGFTFQRLPPPRGRGRGRGRSVSKNAFTLLELIVVITIIGILGTLVVVRVGGLTGNAQRTKIKSDMQAIYRAAEYFKVQTGSFPQTVDELKNPPQNTASGGQAMEALLDQNIKDPWSNDYIYEMDSNGKPRVRCLGKDGADGGDQDNQDYSWPEEAGA